MLTFNETIDSFFRTIPSKVFVNDEIRKLSCRELETRETKLANYFKK